MFRSSLFGRTCIQMKKSGFGLSTALLFSARSRHYCTALVHKDFRLIRSSNPWRVSLGSFLILTYRTKIALLQSVTMFRSSQACWLLFINNKIGYWASPILAALRSGPPTSLLDLLICRVLS